MSPVRCLLLLAFLAVAPLGASAADAQLTPKERAAIDRMHALRTELAKVRRRDLRILAALSPWLAHISGQTVPRLLWLIVHHAAPDFRAFPGDLKRVAKLGRIADRAIRAALAEDNSTATNANSPMSGH